MTHTRFARKEWKAQYQAQRGTALFIYPKPVPYQEIFSALGILGKAAFIGLPIFSLNHIEERQHKVAQ